MKDRAQPKQLKRLLIVDDESAVALAVASNLEKMSGEYSIEMANSADEALTKIRKDAYALVLTDYKMPDMNGLDLARAVRQISPDTQVVLMTGYGTTGLSETVEQLELGGYIDKPFTMDQIQEVVARAIESTKIGDPTPQADAPLMVSLNERLVKLLSNTDSLCVLLLSSGGYPLEVVGSTDTLDIVSVGALVSANFSASEALAKLLGSNSVFKSSYHEGPEYNIYAYNVNDDLLLAVIFNPETRPGTVWHYAKKTAVEIEGLVISQPTAVELDRDMIDGITSEIEQLFVGGDDGDLDEVTTMSFKNAVEAGLIPSGIGVEEPDLQKNRKKSVRHQRVVDAHNL